MCPFGLAAGTFVFFALGGGDRQALYELGDGVNAPFYGVDGGAVVDEVVRPINGALLAFFGFGAGVSVNRLIEIKGASWEQRTLRGNDPLVVSRIVYVDRKSVV